MGTRSLVLLLLALTGLASARNSTTAGLKPNERFRRLIPYMTFYFAQQNYGSRPQFQQYHSPASVYPISNNKLPQYQGNLVVPTTYLVRPSPQVNKRPQVQYQLPQSNLHHTQTFSANDDTNYNTLLNSDTYSDPLVHTYEVPQIKHYENPGVVSQSTYSAIKPPPLSIEARTNALIRILSILQQARRLPQAVTDNNSVQTLAQILHILQQTNQLPIETQSSLSKFLTQIPHYYKQPQAVSISTGGHLKAPPANVNVKLLQTLSAANNAGKPLVPIYTTKLLPQLTTPTSQTDQEVNILQSYNTAPPKLRPAITAPNTPSISGGYTITLSTTPTPAVEQANDLQNYDYVPNVKVVPNGEDSNRPLPHSPAPTQVPVQPVVDDVDNLQPYVYANKVPQDFKTPSYYGGSTFTQSYPDPNSEGSTPGRAGVDYPTYSSIPPTSFTCKSQRYKGFFGDPETSCQVWHYCDLNGGQASFLCPNGTIFSQVGLTCDWWFNVRCASTAQLYVLNERLYKYILPVMPSFPEDYSGPLVDQYITLKFQEQEEKKKAKLSQEKATTTTTEASIEQDQH